MKLGLVVGRAGFGLSTSGKPAGSCWLFRLSGYFSRFWQLFSLRSA